MSDGPELPWSRDLLAAVGTAYRDASGRGEGQIASFEAAEVAYITAGGPGDDVRTTVHSMLNYLGREHGDWLFGPAMAWRDGHPLDARPHTGQFEVPKDVA